MTSPKRSLALALTLALGLPGMAPAEEGGDVLKPAQAGAQPVPIAVAKLAAAPKVDGDLADWGTDGWVKVPVQPAIIGDGKNKAGKLEVKLKAGVAGDSFFMALQWPDPKADTTYRPWEWNEGKGKHERSKLRDDMMAVRFEVDGDFDSCMLSKKVYRVDLWQWSAGRTNRAGLAEDYLHTLSSKPLEDAAEFPMADGGTTYIKKSLDAGANLWENAKADPAKKETQDGVVIPPNPAGSSADVLAKGSWKDGVWTLELSRKLDTTHPDDRPFKVGEKIRGQIAVFNEGWAEHKSFSDVLLFDFAGIN
ncbi:MAG: hypothetical protein HQL51_15290 [Magnetococcales bacterium]|nr:hypothetical protein [Magnetococcales bacterium]